MEKDTHLYMLGNNEKQEGEKFRQYFAAIIVSLGAVSVGTVLAWTSPVLPQLTQTSNTTNSYADTSLQLTDEEGAFVGSVLAIGALVSALPSGFIADRIGRKRSIILFGAFFLLSWFMVALASGVGILYGARFCAGVATGAMCVLCPMYIGEIAEPSVKGTLGSIFQMLINVGIFVTYLLGSLFDWYTLSMCLSVIPVLFLATFAFVPESPVYLFKRGDVNRAEINLAYFRGANYDVDLELKQLQRDTSNTQCKPSGIKHLFAHYNRRALISALGLMVFQQLSGINAVIFYTVTIFKSAGSSISADLTSIIVAAISVAMACVSVLVIDKAGRKFFLILSSTGMVACLVALGFYFHMKELEVFFTGMDMLPLASLGLFIVFFSLGYGPIPWMIMGELFSADIKGVASGLAVMVNWGFVFLVTCGFPVMKARFGGYVTFYLFGGVMGVATVFVQFVVPETKVRV